MAVDFNTRKAPHPARKQKLNTNFGVLDTSLVSTALYLLLNRFHYSHPLLLNLDIAFVTQKKKKKKERIGLSAGDREC